MICLELSQKDLRRIYAVDLMVYKYYKCSLYSFCEKYHFDKLFLEIIKQVTTDTGYDRLGYFEVNLDDEFEEEYYAVEKKFSYGVDNRSVVERVISLGVNWVVEDVIVHKSSSVFILTGCDNTRDLLANPITNTPDIRYVGKGDSFYVEVCSDFTRFMQKNKRYDLRKLKYYKLEDLKKIERTETLLLFVDVVNKQYYMTWFVPRGFIYFDKYVKNTVAFEFNENVKFNDLMELFKFCRECQPDSSLYSNFNVDDSVKKSSSKYLPDYECDEYWESLFKSEPKYIRQMTEEQFLQYAECSEDRDYTQDPNYPVDEDYMGSEIDDSDCPEVKVGFSEIETISDEELNEIFSRPLEEDNCDFGFSNPFSGPFDDLPF